MKAYHFVNNTLRDGQPIPEDGVKMVFEAEPILCQQGLHASKHVYDALRYAPGNTLCLVECGGKIVHGDDKLVCTERTIVKRFDAEDMLREYARWCALQVVHLWDCPDVVLQYLQTGDIALRDAARTAAHAAYAASAAGAARAASAASAAGAARAASAASAASAACNAVWGVDWDVEEKKQRRKIATMVNRRFKEC